MTVYVVIRHEYGEGWQLPEMVFALRENAENYIKVQRRPMQFCIEETSFDSRLTEGRIREARLSG